MDSPNEMSDAGGKGILDLPDDCLFDICRHLSLQDLSSTALTCTRLHSIARQTFSLKPEKKLLNVQHLIRSFGSNSIQAFGDLLVDLTLDLTDAKYNPIDEWTSMNDPILNLASKYCSDGALDTIRLSGVTLGSPLSGEMVRLFSRLKKIRLDFCTGFSELLAANKDCEDLQISGRKWMDDFNFNLRFPKLKTFVLRFSLISNQKLNVDCADFLQHHTNLKILKLHVSSKSEFNLNAIAGLKDLEVLKLAQIEGPRGISLNAFCDLKHLKTLVVDSPLTDAAEFLIRSVATKSLEYLALDCAVFNADMVVGLSRFEVLQTLKLATCHGMSTEHLLQWNAGELTHLILENMFHFTINNLLDMIEKCGKLQSVTLAFMRHCHTIDSDAYERLVEICREQNKKLTVISIGGTIRNDINNDTSATEVIPRISSYYKLRKPKTRLYNYTSIKQ